MRTVDRTPIRECRLLLWPVALLLTLALTTQGCSQVKSLWGSGDDTDLDDAAYANEGEPLPPPIANVAISYRRPGDALARATVIKYFGAEVIANHQRDASHTESVVRFDGGVPIWEFKADEGTFGSITGVGAAKYTLNNIEYAKLPPHFTQILPEEGPPEPLDRGAYYVFQIERQSGSSSYQAVKVQADGSLQAYNAQPRAGSSYLLCCNVTVDFPEPVILPETTQDTGAGSAPPDESPDQSGGSAGGAP
ncbi:MAG: hypothetical protein ABSB13_06430 [Candidatus Binatus sp.]|uniref:hypothetical protein n=1 Tax=Candidatus Binatus sp. TaxID=2811406 RepID=UPI003D103473